MLDDFVVNALDERLTGVDYDGVRTSEGLGEEAVRAATWVALPGGGTEVEEAEAARDEAREDLDGFLADTTLRRVLGADKFAETVSDYVAVVSKAEADLEEARGRHSGRHELVDRLWLHEWGNAEKREYLARMLASVAVTRGRGPMSGRVEVELR